MHIANTNCWWASPADGPIAGAQFADSLPAIGPIVGAHTLHRQQFACKSTHRWRAFCRQFARKRAHRTLETSTHTNKHARAHGGAPLRVGAQRAGPAAGVCGCTHRTFLNRSEKVMSEASSDCSSLLFPDPPCQLRWWRRRFCFESGDGGDCAPGGSTALSQPCHSN